MRKIFAVLMLSLLCVSINAKDIFEYEVVSAGVATEGSELVKVYSYASNQKKAIELGKKNAVHAILFKGVPGSNGNYTKPAMVKNADYEANEDFFDKFFKSGKYLQFVALSTDGVIDPSDMLRVGGRYKIGIVYVVNKAALRQYLESEGIIKGMNSMFE